MFAIDTNGCQDVPFVDQAAQTYFNYLNGSAGYIVFAVGTGLLVISMISKKKLGQLPGWLAGVVIAALAIGSFPVILGAFGVNLGCNGGGGIVVEAPAEEG